MESKTKANLIVHPQAIDLRRRNRQMQLEAARRLVERDKLKDSAVPQICAEYQCVIGWLELRVFQFECQVRALIRRIEIANAALNRGEKPLYRRIEAEIETEFAAWREKIAAQIAEIKDARELTELPVLSRPESRELQTLYRKLALVLHPDIGGATDERRRQLWLQTAEAYRNGDLQMLRTIRLLTDADADGTDAPTENILQTLENRHRELKTTCENLLGEIFEIKNSPLYLLHKILDDPAKLAEKQRELGERIKILREKRARLIEHWAEVMRFAADGDAVELPTEPADIFVENDFDWAEFVY